MAKTLRRRKKDRRRMTRSNDRQQQAQVTATLLEKLGNPTWDLLLVGDGSGGDWEKACGWASCLVDKATHGRRFFYGAMDCGSVNFAEAMPYIQALNWFDNNFGRERLKTTGFLNVHILTDSQVIARMGNQTMAKDEPIPRTHALLWGALTELRRLGYICQFHWAPRMSTKWNQSADLIAGLCRKEVQAALAPDYAPGEIAARAAHAIESLVFYDPHTGLPLSAYTLPL